MHFYFVEQHNGEKWTKLPRGIYQAADKITVILRDERGLHYKFTVLPGFQTNGGSVPLCFRWLIPSWTEDNVLVNLSYALHDGLYGSELMCREYADDLLRGLLRDAGWPRWKASLVCYAVNQFAASHYGQDKDPEENRLFFKMELYIDD